MSTFNPQAIRVLAPASILFGAACLATPVQSADLEAGRKTFETTCAVCHGPAGKADPSSPTVQSLDPKPADRSDPLFNSREPASDWNIVVTHGGTLDTLTARWLLFDEERVSHIGFATHVTGITVLQKDELGHRRVERSNDIGHLSGQPGHVALGAILA